MINSFFQPRFIETADDSQQEIYASEFVLFEILRFLFVSVISRKRRERSFEWSGEKKPPLKSVNRATSAKEVEFFPLPAERAIYLVVITSSVGNGLTRNAKRRLFRRFFPFFFFAIDLTAPRSSFFYISLHFFFFFFFAFRFDDRRETTNLLRFKISGS